MSSPRTADLAADPRVRRGLAAQLERRRERIAGGETPLGWKLGFGTPQAMERLAIPAPLIGFLTDRSELEAADGAAVGEWKQPLVEPEVAVWLGEDVEPGGGPAEAAAAVEALAPAFELADLDREPADVEAILASNVFHRAVALGPRVDAARAPLTGLSARIAGPGEALAEVAAADEATGPIAILVRHVADLLGHFDERLRAGQLIICGSLVPPIGVAPGDSVSYRLDPVGALSIRLR